MVVMNKYLKWIDRMQTFWKSAVWTQTQPKYNITAFQKKTQHFRKHNNITGSTITFQEAEWHFRKYSNILRITTICCVWPAGLPSKRHVEMKHPSLSPLRLVPGVQVSGSLGEEWGTERRPGGHLHAHGAAGHVHHVGVRPDRCPTQPHLWRLRFQRALCSHQSRQG